MQDVREICFGILVDDLPGGEGLAGIEAHVQRAFVLEAKATVRFVELESRVWVAMVLVSPRDTVICGSVSDLKPVRLNATE